MTEADWLACSEAARMLKAAKARFRHRKLRLFAVACGRRIYDLLPDWRSRAAIDVAGRFADGEASDVELREARQAAAAAHREAFGRLGKIRASLEWAAEFCAEPFAFRAAKNVSWMSAIPREAGQVVSDYQAQAEWVRDILGNPFRPVTLDPSWLTPAVVQLAARIYAERTFGRVAELADALERAGCRDELVLAHCLGPAPHVRGCWVVDLLLGKA